VSKCLNGTLFSPEQLKTIFSLMRETLDLSEANSSPSCSSMAAIIVKNDRKFKVTSAVSQTDKSPINHAEIVAIENVSNIHQKAKNRDDGVE
ncbi:hypothetical protein ELK79_28330, partial [Klebsiella pneumoniae]|nr:hypothetical protein [Klebsiella pneumoniae]